MSLTSLCMTVCAIGCVDGSIRLNGHSFGSVRCVAFSHDGAQLASAADDGRVIVWDAATGRRLHTLLPNRATASWREGQALIVRDDGTSEPLVSKDQVAVRWVGYPKDSRALIALTSEVVTYDTTIGREIRRVVPEQTHGADWTFAAPILSSDGRYLVSLWRQAQDAQRLLLDVRHTGSLRARMQIDVSDLLPRSVAIDSRGGFLAAAGERRVLVWHIDKSVLLHDDSLGSETVRSIAFGQSDVGLITVDDSWSVTAVDTRTATTTWAASLADLPHAVAAGREFFASLLTDRPRERVAVGCGWSIAVLDTKTGRRLNTVRTGLAGQERQIAPVSLVGFVNSDRLLTVGNSRIQVWSVAAGRLIWESALIEEGVTAVAISPDGLRVATGGGWAKKEPTVRLFQLPNNTEGPGTSP